MVSEERVRLRVSYTGSVRELYDGVIGVDGVVREEYVRDTAELEGEVVDSVMFTLDIVFDSSSVSERSVVSAVRAVDGVESVSRMA